MRTGIALSILCMLGSAAAAPAPKADYVKKPGWRPHVHQQQQQRRAAYINEGALNNDYPTVTAPKKNPWLYLSDDEAASVIAFLHDQESLNLTAVDDAGAWDNTILVVDVSPPKKADVVAYLDGDGPEPARYVTASLMFGATEEPYVQEYIVGPLPISNATTIEVDTFHNPSAKDAKIRVYDMDDSYSLYVNKSMEIKDILSDLFQTPIDTEDDLNGNFSIWGIDPLWQ